MSDESPQMGVGRFALKATNTFIGVAAVVACLTVLFNCMQAVMEIGGSCASGGPYEIARPCPKGVGWMTPVSIFVGLAALGWMIAWNHGLSGPKWALLAWPALFLSLGYNFWDYGLDTPGEQGAVAGWIVCGVLFGLMGGLPLLALRVAHAAPGDVLERRVRFRRWTACRQTDRAHGDPGRQADLPAAIFDDSTAVVVAATVFASINPRHHTRRHHTRRARATPRPSWSANCNGWLRCTAAGELTDDEFAIAKQALLRAT